MRIVSLLPSATEIVCALGLRAQLVGVSHECDFPPDVQELPQVTKSHLPFASSSADIDRLVGERLASSQPLYSLDQKVLAELAPDLIVTQSLCEVCAVCEMDVRTAAGSLPKHPRVLTLGPESLEEVFISMRQVAAATDTLPHYESVVAALKERIDQVTRRVAKRSSPRPRVAFLEWLDPLFSAGHWNGELIRLAGGIDQCGAAGQPSRRLAWKTILQWRPEVVVIACCGFAVERTLADLPLLTRMTGWNDLPAVRSGRVFVMDGSQYFNRPGPRLVDSLEMLAYVLDPQGHPQPAGQIVTLKV